MTQPNPADYFKNQKIIGGKRYSIQSLRGRASLKGFATLIKIAGPVFGEVIDSRNVDEDIAMFEKQNTFREILTLVTNNIDSDDMWMLVDQMLAGATCESESIDYDAHFEGDINGLIELIVYALEVNFKKLFTENAMFQSTIKGLGKVMSGISPS